MSEIASRPFGSLLTAMVTPMKDDGDVDFTLPPGPTWKRLIDTQSYYDTLGYLNDKKLSTRATANVTLDSPEAIATAKYGVKSRSIVVLEAR